MTLDTIVSINHAEYLGHEKNPGNRYRARQYRNSCACAEGQTEKERKEKKNTHLSLDEQLDCYSIYSKSSVTNHFQSKMKTPRSLLLGHHQSSNMRKNRNEYGHILLNEFILFT